MATATTASTYNCDGDPLTISVTTGGLVGDAMRNYGKVTTNVYGASDKTGDKWLLGRLTRATVVSTAPDFVLTPETVGSAAVTEPVRSIALRTLPVVGSRSTPGTVTATVHARAGGPNGPLRYEWSRIGGSRTVVAGTYSSSFMAGETATFSATVGWGENLQETFRVEATDALGTYRMEHFTVTFTTPPQPPLTLSIQPPLVMSRSTDGTVSSKVSALSVGGSAPYSYAWARLSGSRLSFSATGQSNTFSAYVNSSSGTFTETFRVTATDSVNTVRTLDFDVVTTGPSNLSVSLSLPSPQEHYDVEPPFSIIEEVTASASGGVAPYSFSWEVISSTRASGQETLLLSDNGEWNMIEVPVTWGDSFTDVVRVTVTDALGTQRHTDLAFIATGMYAD
jgi:hypothetical protein